MTHDALFGELRSILQRPASIETWDALCQHLDLWPADTLEQVALPYALDLVSRWPDEVQRVAPGRWVVRFLEGRDMALATLVNRLELANQAIAPAQLLALVASHNLTSLHLLWIHIGPQGAKSLAASPHLKQLTSLELRVCQLGDAGVKALVNSPNLERLTSLDLYSNRIGAWGAKALANSSHLTRLTSLNLYGNSIGARGAAALANSPHLSNLTSLDLRNNNIGATGAKALAASPYLRDSIRALWRE